MIMTQTVWPDTCCGINECNYYPALSESNCFTCSRQVCQRRTMNRRSLFSWSNLKAFDSGCSLFYSIYMIRCWNCSQIHGKHWFIVHLHSCVEPSSDTYLSTYWLSDNWLGFSIFVFMLVHYTTGTSFLTTCGTQFPSLHLKTFLFR